MRFVVFLVLAAGCASKLKVEPVKVEPIHMTIDVNVHDGQQPNQPPKR